MPAVRVTVTTDDIALGVRHCPSCCPVGRAVAAACPGARRVTIVPIRGRGWLARLYDRRGRCRSAILPPDICGWLDRYVADPAWVPGAVGFDLELGD